MNAIPSWVRRAIAVRYVEILQGLVKEPPVVGPIFWPESHGDSVAMDWCEGFMEAVDLRPKEWLRLSESGKDS